ncbi:hypothetical protein BGZ93_000398 [Podila epicladia]|nr:hypothetical protein BGZ92_000999 [Podila epicladia]KAG0085891.1 hypothetical protein BGZ93_000398 [Podila epicladia]
MGFSPSTHSSARWFKTDYDCNPEDPSDMSQVPFPASLEKYDHLVKHLCIHYDESRFFLPDREYGDSTMDGDKPGRPLYGLEQEKICATILDVCSTFKILELNCIHGSKWYRPNSGCVGQF